MVVTLRNAQDEDQDFFIQSVLALSRFNRRHHHPDSCYDNYEEVLQAIEARALDTFKRRDENTLILIAETDIQPVGYALARIHTEEAVADNGTGRIALFDELFVYEEGRGLGIGRMLVDSVIEWTKDQNVRRLKLHAYSWNTKAKDMYEKYGFKEYAVSYEVFL